MLLTIRAHINERATGESRTFEIAFRRGESHISLAIHRCVSLPFIRSVASFTKPASCTGCASSAATLAPARERSQFLPLLDPPARHCARQGPSRSALAQDSLGVRGPHCTYAAMWLLGPSFASVSPPSCRSRSGPWVLGDLDCHIPRFFSIANHPDCTRLLLECPLPTAGWRRPRLPPAPTDGRLYRKRLCREARCHAYKTANPLGGRTA